MDPSNIMAGTPAPAELQVFQLTRAALLLVWDSAGVPPRTRLVAMNGGVPFRTRFITTRLSLAGQGRRTLLALVHHGAPLDPAGLAVSDVEGRLIAREKESWRGEPDPFDAARLLTGLDTSQRIACARFLLANCPAVLQLSHNPDYVACCRELLSELKLKAQPFAPRARVLDDYVLCECVTPKRLGQQLSAVAIAAPAIVFLGEGVIPEAATWLEALLHALAAGPARSLVAAPTLYHDGSIAAAGADAALDASGRWELRNRFAGFPRGYPALVKAAAAPIAATGCLALPRALFEAVGGFAPDYLGPFHRDADLSARVWQAVGHVSVMAEPYVVAVHADDPEAAANSALARELAVRTRTRQPRRAHRKPRTRPRRPSWRSDSSSIRAACSSSAIWPHCPRQQPRSALPPAPAMPRANGAVSPGHPRAVRKRA